MDGDDATVEVEEDGFEEQVENLDNRNPFFLTAFYHGATSFLAAYGWTMMVLVVFCIMLWSNFAPKIRKFLEKREEETSDTDADLIARRAEERELALQRMQEKASAILKKEAERRKELEELKQREKIEDYDASKGGRSSHATQRKMEYSERSQQETKKNNSRPQARPLRNDYNPLTGTSSNSRYRSAPRRSGGG